MYVLCNVYVALLRLLRVLSDVYRSHEYVPETRCRQVAHDARRKHGPRIPSDDNIFRECFRHPTRAYIQLSACDSHLVHFPYGQASVQIHLDIYEFQGLGFSLATTAMR